MRRSIILTVSSRALTPVLLLVSIYVTFRGHNAPGGGFAGGLVMAAAIVLRFLSEGMPGVRTFRLDPILLIATGLGVALATTAAPLFFGKHVMDSQIWHLDVPVIGDIKFVTAAIFDIGVHILVVGVVVSILLAFAQADDEASEVTA